MKISILLLFAVVCSRICFAQTINASDFEALRIKGIFTYTDTSKKTFGNNSDGIPSMDVCFDQIVFDKIEKKLSISGGVYFDAGTKCTVPIGGTKIYLGRIQGNEVSSLIEIDSSSCLRLDTSNQSKLSNTFCAAFHFEKDDVLFFYNSGFYLVHYDIGKLQTSGESTSSELLQQQSD